jgi:hypothetical protein
VRSPLETFAGLLDQSVREIAALAADARTIDLPRISRIAGIWDNSTFPLVSAACAPRLARTGQARAGLRWMAGLGAPRRELMTDLDPALDAALPAAGPATAVHRDYQGQARPGSRQVAGMADVGYLHGEDTAVGSGELDRESERGLEAGLVIRRPAPQPPAVDDPVDGDEP